MSEYKINEMMGGVHKFFNNLETEAGYIKDRISNYVNDKTHSSTNTLYKAVCLSVNQNVNTSYKSLETAGQANPLVKVNLGNSGTSRWQVKIRIIALHAVLGVDVPFTNYLPNPFDKSIDEKERQYRIRLHPNAFTETSIHKDKSLSYGSVLTVKRINGIFVIQNKYGIKKMPHTGHNGGETSQEWRGEGHLGKVTGPAKDVDWKKYEGAYTGKIPPKIKDKDMPNMFAPIPNAKNCYRGGIHFGKDANKKYIPPTFAMMKKMAAPPPKGYGIKTFITLASNWNAQLKAWGGQVGIEIIYAPLTHLKAGSPEMTRLNNLWPTIWRKIDEGNCYVHCKHGVDRTGAVVGRWLWDDESTEYINESPSGRPYTEAQAYGYTVKLACPPGWGGCQWKSKADLNGPARAWAFPSFKVRDKKIEGGK